MCRSAGKEAIVDMLAIISSNLRVALLMRMCSCSSILYEQMQHKLWMLLLLCMLAQFCR